MVPIGVFDDDTEAAVTLADVPSDAGAERLEAILEGAKSDEMKQLLVATCLEEESLEAYVARVHPQLDEAEKIAMTAKLRKKRREELQRLKGNVRGVRAPA